MIGRNDANERANDLTSRFDEQTARDALGQACTAADVECVNPRLLRLGENAIFRLNGLVVRVARGPAHWDDAVKEVNVARWLSQADFPGARLADLPQPLLIRDTYPVTFWNFIDGPNGGPSDIDTLAALLNRLHKLPRPKTFELPEQELLSKIEPRIDTAPIEPDDKRFLLQLCDRLKGEIAELDYELPAGPVHGDAHVQNLMFTGHTPTMIDFEAVSWGQPEWDLGLTATEYETAGWWTADQYQEFTDSYGYDVTQWDGFPVVQATHELKMTTWIMQNVETSDRIAQEYATRIATLRRRENIGRWSAF
ncbi:phosphotransferase enzyme family protein [Saccharothrix australiensis]|uniref:Thiamine kinase-like enzyme n=1 Tax=Saccharothrix australiensis TaxID=2072 RepID=A0A495W9N3_9PSEU|nr:aminoglycoside phosphotransferase family protein [Saccharothrix australiensis]RKT57830.1 thiamine kinase-like enzyme [Saccharothrix australiensis]